MSIENYVAIDREELARLRADSAELEILRGTDLAPGYLVGRTSKPFEFHVVWDGETDPSIEIWYGQFIRCAEPLLPKHMLAAVGRKILEWSRNDDICRLRADSTKAATPARDIAAAQQGGKRHG